MQWFQLLQKMQQFKEVEVWSCIVQKMHFGYQIQQVPFLKKISVVRKFRTVQILEGKSVKNTVYFLANKKRNKKENEKES